MEQPCFGVYPAELFILQDGGADWSDRRTLFFSAGVVVVVRTLKWAPPKCNPEISEVNDYIETRAILR
jgi:hypothetical protein